MEFVKRLLKNEIQGGAKEWLLLNAATLLYAAGKGATISACLAGARQTLESGAAAQKLTISQQQRRSLPVLPADG